MTDEVPKRHKTWRQKLEEVGGWENEMVSVPAGAVRKIIEDLEAHERELERVKAERDGLRRALNITYG